MKQFLRYSLVALLAMSGIHNAKADTDVIFTFNTDEGLTELGIAKPEAGNGTNLASLSPANTLTKGVITITNTTGEGKTETRVWNSNGNLDLRIYSTSKLTFKTSEKVIKSIVLTGGAVGSFDASSGAFNAGTWEGSSAEVTLTAKANEKINTITVTYGDAAAVNVPTIDGISPAKGSTQVTITGDSGAEIYYTTDGTDPTASSIKYTSAFTINTTTTVKAIAIKGATTSTIATKKFIIVSGSGTTEDPYNVADALLLIENEAAPPTAVNVKGIVTNIKSIQTEQYFNAEFEISDDATASNKLLVYRAKGLEKEDIKTSDYIKVNDVVIINGKLTLYNSTPEFTTGCYIYSLNNKTTSDISIVKADAEANVPAYNLAGQKVDNSYKGLIIKNGKKVINK